MSAAARNVQLYPWFKFFQNLLFWQSTWFLFFQSELSAAQAILIYVFFEISTTIFEVPSGYLSDLVGRRFTLILSGLAGLTSALMQWFGGDFWVFAIAQIALGAHMAFASGTDSALLFESLAEDNRADEIEAQELRAWRFTMAAFAISAVTGGAMALIDLRLPFAATASALVILILITFRLTEPHHAKRMAQAASRLTVLRQALTHPTLIWLFALWVLMMGFGHIPFVFGQPYIFASLETFGFSANAPVISGAVTAAMMLLSILTSWIAPGLRQRIGLGGILLLAFGLQVSLVAGLAVTGSAFAIALLLLRMVPESFSRPFILARIQPLLSDDVRATFISLRSLAGRLLFALSLYIASVNANQVGEMQLSEIQSVLAVYAAIGVAAFFALLALRKGRDI